jgi:hypothetical protein
MIKRTTLVSYLSFEISGSLLTQALKVDTHLWEVQDKIDVPLRSYLLQIRNQYWLTET